MIVVLGFIVTMLVFTVIRGVTIDVFWDWFLAGHGTPFDSQLGPITFWQALGLSLIVSVFVFSTTGSDADAEANDGKKPAEIMVRSVGAGVFIYAFWWIFALIIHGQLA